MILIHGPGCVFGQHYSMGTQGSKTALWIFLGRGCRSSMNQWNEKEKYLWVIAHTKFPQVLVQAFSLERRILCVGCSELVIHSPGSTRCCTSPIRSKCGLFRNTEDVWRMWMCWDENEATNSWQQEKKSIMPLQSENPGHRKFITASCCLRERIKTTHLV